MKNDKLFSLISIIVIFIGCLLCFIIPSRSIHLILLLVLCIVSLILVILSVIKKRNLFNIIVLILVLLFTLFVALLNGYYYRKIFNTKTYNNIEEKFVTKMKTLEKDFADDVEYTVSNKQLEQPSLNNKVIISKQVYEDFIDEYNKEIIFNSEKLISPFKAENINYCDGYVIVKNENNKLNSKAYLSCNNDVNYYATKGYDKSLLDPISNEKYLSIKAYDKSKLDGTEYKINADFGDYRIIKNIYQNSLIDTLEYPLDDTSKKQMIRLLNIYDVLNWKNANSIDNCSFESNSLFAISINEINRSKYYCILDTQDSNLGYARNIIDLINSFIEENKS